MYKVFEKKNHIMSLSNNLTNSYSNHLYFCVETVYNSMFNIMSFSFQVQKRYQRIKKRGVLCLLRVRSNNVEHDCAAVRELTKYPPDLNMTRKFP